MSQRPEPYERQPPLGADRLPPVMAELDAAHTRLTDLQDKASRIARDLLTASRENARRPSDRLAAEITRLSASLDSTRSTIARTQKRTERLTRSFSATLTQFGTRADHQGSELAELRSEIARHHRRNGAMARAMVSVLRRPAALLGHQDAQLPNDFALPEGSYDYIPIDLLYYFDALIRLDGLLALDPAYQQDGALYRPIRFLEVGAGHGRNIVLTKAARVMNLAECYGFDINSDLVASGQVAYDLADELGVNDAMTFDYGGWDVIFSYRPFQNNAMQEQLEARIAETMSPSAYLLAPLQCDLTLYPQLAKVGTQGDIFQRQP